MFLSCDPHEGGTVGSVAPGQQTVLNISYDRNWDDHSLLDYICLVSAQSKNVACIFLQKLTWGRVSGTGPSFLLIV